MPEELVFHLQEDVSGLYNTQRYFHYLFFETGIISGNLDKEDTSKSDFIKLDGGSQIYHFSPNLRIPVDRKVIGNPIIISRQDLEKVEKGFIEFGDNELFPRFSDAYFSEQPFLANFALLIGEEEIKNNFFKLHEPCLDYFWAPLLYMEKSVVRSLKIF